MNPKDIAAHASALLPQAQEDFFVAVLKALDNRARFTLCDVVRAECPDQFNDDNGDLFESE